MGLIGTARPLASLSSGLLARKGQARPAMRPQFIMDMTAASLEDLGWNDMGGPVAPSPVEAEVAPQVAAVAEPPSSPPPVIAEREALRTQIERPVPVPMAQPVDHGVSPATAARIGRESAAQTARGKAAFTLRLDADRHLRLRLAAAVAGRSAQALMTEAFDQFLTTMPAVEPLAAQVATSPQISRGRSRR